MIFKRFDEKQDLIHVMVDLLVESCFASQNKRYERHWLAGVTWAWTFDYNLKTIGRKPINQTGLPSQESPLSNDIKFDGSTALAAIWVTRTVSIFRKNATASN